MGFLVWITVILTIIYVGMLNDCENFYEKALVSIIYFSIFVAIAFFTKSDLVCNMHMKAYEEGKLGKVYTIRDTDTTYRWIYYEKD